MSRPPESKNRPASRLALSVALGVALIPLSAVGAVLMTEHRPEATNQTAAVEAPTTTPPQPTAVPQYVYSNGEATAEDLAYSCGEGGAALVSAENDGTISEIQQSALDALRGICESQGTPLPGKEGPPPIVETRTVMVDKPSPPATAVATSTPPETTTTSEAAQKAKQPSDSEGAAPTTVATQAPSATAAMGTPERYAAVHDQAISEIEHAISAGGSPEKISEARKKLAEAEKAAQSGNFEEATKQAYEAIDTAREAIGEEGD